MDYFESSVLSGPGQLQRANEAAEGHKLMSVILITTEDYAKA